MSSQYCEIFEQVMMGVPKAKFACATGGCTRILQDINWVDLLFLFSHKLCIKQNSIFKAKRHLPYMQMIKRKPVK